MECLEGEKQRSTWVRGSAGGNRKHLDWQIFFTLEYFYMLILCSCLEDTSLKVETELCVQLQFRLTLLVCEL